MARPEKWKPEYVRIAAHACQLGATDQDVADMLGVSVRTIYNWRATKPEFADALKLGKEPADNRVKASLFHRAVGYSHPEDDIRAVNGEIVVTPTIKHYPPDTAACIFWLKNRCPDEFRQNPEEPPLDDNDRVVRIVRATKHDQQPTDAASTD